MTVAPGVEARAGASLGKAHGAIHAVVDRLLASRRARGTLLDVGCGRGDFYRLARSRFARVIGIDAVRYDGLPPEVEWRWADLERGRVPADDESADATVAIEVIEHIDNPRALCREMARVTRPGGYVVMTTPNQASLLSVLALATKAQFPAFQELDYPAHRTALLPIDLQRIAAECGLSDVEVAYTEWGRLPLTGAHYPRAIAAAWPRGFSDNVAIIGRR